MLMFFGDSIPQTASRSALLSGSKTPDVLKKKAGGGFTPTSFPTKHFPVLVYYGVEFESATGLVGCKDCAARVESAVPKSKRRSQPGGMTDEFAPTLPSGTVAVFVISLLLERQRLSVRFRLPFQRTKFPTKMRATPNIAKRNGSEKTPSKIWVSRSLVTGLETDKSIGVPLELLDPSFTFSEDPNSKALVVAKPAWKFVDRP